MLFSCLLQEHINNNIHTQISINTVIIQLSAQHLLSAHLE